MSAHKVKRLARKHLSRNAELFTITGNQVTKPRSRVGGLIATGLLALHTIARR